MHILLIEDDDRLRADVLEYLRRCKYRVTSCRSVGQAEENLPFVANATSAPDIVIAGARILRKGHRRFRDTLSERFPGLRWIVLPANGDLVLLAETLGRMIEAAASDGADMLRARRLNVLVVEQKDDVRAAIVDGVCDKYDCVSSCRSIAEASKLLLRASSSLEPFDAIVCSVSQPDGDGLSLYMAAKQRFPNIRWIVAPGLLAADATERAELRRPALSVTGPTMLQTFDLPTGGKSAGRQKSGG